MFKIELAARYVFILAITLFIGILLYTVYTQTNKIAETYIDSAANQSLSLFERDLNRMIFSLSRFQLKYNSNAYKNVKNIKKDAQIYLKNLKYLKLLSILSKDSNTILTVGTNFSYKKLLDNLITNKQLEPYLTNLHEDISPPVRWGAHTIQILSFPVKDGTIVSFISLQDLIEDINKYYSEFIIQLVAGNGSVYHSNAGNGSNESTLVKTKNIFILGSTYQIKLYINKSSILDQLYTLPLRLMLVFIMVIGLVSSYFFSSIKSLKTTSKLSSLRRFTNELRTNNKRLQQTAERQRRALDTGNIGLWIWDIKNDVLQWNLQMYELYNVSPDSKPVFSTWSSSLLEQDKYKAISDVNRALSGQEKFNTSFRIIVNNRVKYIKAYGFVERDSDNAALFFIGINFDISKEIYLQELCDKHKFIFWEFNRSEKNFSFSTEGVHHLQLPNHLIHKCPIEDFLNKLDDISKKKITSTLLEGENMEINEYFEINISTEKGSIPFSAYILSVLNNNGVFLYRGFFQNVSLLKKYKDKSKHDQQTGLLNKECIKKKLNELTCKKHRQQDTFGVFYIDIDNFKDINDNYGHKIGDVFIEHLGKNILGSLRSNDFAGRIGGDEFLVIYQGVSKTNVVDLAKKLLNCVSFSLSIQNTNVSCHSSIGIALYPKDGEDAGSLINNADAAMYKAKKSKENSYVFFTK